MSWEQLEAILKENKREQEKAGDKTPADCPVCGEQLDRRDNQLNCPMGHWRGNQ